MAHEKNVEVSRGGHTKDETGAKESNEGYGVRNLSHGSLQRTNGRRCNLFSGKGVDNTGNNNVDGRGDALLDCDRAWKVTGGVLHFSQNCRERLVAGVSEGDVEESRDSLCEVGVSDSLDVQGGRRVSWSLYSERNHNDEDSGDDGDGARPRSPRDEAHAVRYAHRPHCDCGDDGKRDRAGSMFADSVESDSQGDQSGSGNKSHVDEKADSENTFDPWSAEYPAVVHDVQHVRVLPPVLDEIVCGIQAQQPHDDDAQDSWEKPEYIESGRKR